jgi:hypothetical protein
MSKLFRLTSAAALTASLLFGATAVISTPSTLAAQITCWACICDGSRCVCEQVACPKEVN